MAGTESPPKQLRPRKPGRSRCSLLGAGGGNSSRPKFFGCWRPDPPTRRPRGGPRPGVVEGQPRGIVVSSVYTRRAARPSQAFSTAPPFEDEAEAAFIFTSPDWALPDTDPEAAPDGGE